MKTDLRTIWKESILPSILQVSVLGIMIFLFAVFLMPLKMPMLPGAVLTEENDPNIPRFIYMLLTIPAALVTLRLASKTENSTARFWAGAAAGLFIWQGLGECSWNFGIIYQGAALFLPRIEGFQGTMLILFFLPLMIRIARSSSVPLHLRSCILSFGNNWLGHYILIGTAPLGMALTGITDLLLWYRLVGIIAGVPAFLLTLYWVFFRAETKEQRLLLSVLLYTFFCVILEGAAGIATKLD